MRARARAPPPTPARPRAQAPHGGVSVLDGVQAQAEAQGELRLPSGGRSVLLQLRPPPPQMVRLRQQSDPSPLRRRQAPQAEQRRDSPQTSPQAPARAQPPPPPQEEEGENPPFMTLSLRLSAAGACPRPANRCVRCR